MSVGEPDIGPLLTACVAYSYVSEPNRLALSSDAVYAMKNSYVFAPAGNVNDTVSVTIPVVAPIDLTFGVEYEYALPLPDTRYPIRQLTVR